MEEKKHLFRCKPWSFMQSHRTLDSSMPWKTGNVGEDEKLHPSSQFFLALSTRAFYDVLPRTFAELDVEELERLKYLRTLVKPHHTTVTSIEDAPPCIPYLCESNRSSVNTRNTSCLPEHRCLPKGLEGCSS